MCYRSIKTLAWQSLLVPITYRSAEHVRNGITTPAPGFDSILTFTFTLIVKQLGKPELLKLDEIMVKLVILD